MERKNVLIIGAGAAGLMAAAELSPCCNVTVLESRPLAGGRIITTHSHGYVIEGGAEFIHGTLPLTLQLASKANLALYKVSEDIYRNKNGLQKQDDMFSGRKELVSKMMAYPYDISLSAFLMKEQYDNDQHESVLQFSKSYDLADPFKAGIKSLAHEWNQMDQPEYRLSNGYGSLINFLQQTASDNNCNFEFNENVIAVEWIDQHVKVRTKSDRVYIADKLLLTVPVSLLQSGARDLIFTSLLHDYHQAADNIGFGSVIKIIMILESPLWPDSGGFYISNDEVSIWWTDNRTPNMITGWIADSFIKYGDAGDEMIIENTISSFCKLFNKTREQIVSKLRTHHIYNWSSAVSRGAYSYTIAGHSDARSKFHTPLNNTIFFAGEAYSIANNGTVEAALETGLEAAKKILQS